MGRGALSEEVKKASLEKLGYEISVRELRLMVYLQYVMVNEQRVDIWKISNEERKILREWREKGYMTGGATQIEMQKTFWDAICEILWYGYVNY